jgi:uncharacterized protein (TIGR01777 family)
MTSDPRRVLLSGASGLVGLALVRALATHRIQSFLLVRGQTKHSGELHWDPSSSHPVENLETLENIDAAIHLSGANLYAHRWTAAYKHEIRESRIATTRALVNVFRQMKKPPRTFLCASATGIYGDRGDEVLSEDSPSGTGFIADVCRDWEAEAARAAEIGVQVTHLRFGPVLTPDGGALKAMLPFFRLGLGGKIASGRQWLSWIASSDMVRSILHLLQNPAAVHGPVNLVTPHPVTNAEFTRSLAHQLHRPAILPVPAFALRAAFGEIADDTLLTSTRVVPQRLLQSGFKFELPSIDAALAALL